MKCVLTAERSSLTIALTFGCVVLARRKTSGRSEVDFADRLLSAMRYQFGGHVEKSGGNSEAA